MIGNDIIDLELSKKQSNWKRQGFLDKLFTTEEKVMISNAPIPEIMVWNLWSRKEAAYKIYQRQTGIRGFIPKQLQCSDCENIDGEILGKVSINETQYFTKTIINCDCIHTIAVVNIEDFGKIQTVERNFISKDDFGIPFHSINKNPVSISHHGRFEKRIQLELDVQS